MRGLPPLVIAIDLGGTHARVAAVEASGAIIARSIQPTDASQEPDSVINDLAEAIAEVCRQARGRQPVGLGIGAPGPIDHESGVLLQAPHLPRWRNVPLARQLEQATGLPTVLGNDANLAALGEARFGAGRGARNLVYLTVSTGVGSGIIVDGALLLGEHGAAAEAGHMTIWWGGRLCPCGNRGCLEAYASGTALAERAREAMEGGRLTILGGQGDDLSAVAIGEAAQQGDLLAQELITEAGTALGLGIRNLLHLFDPSVVVVGGGVTRIGSRLWDAMLEAVNTDALSVYPTRVRIVRAELGDDPGLVGAAALAFDTFSPSPSGRGVG